MKTARSCVALLLVAALFLCSCAKKDAEREMPQSEKESGSSSDLTHADNHETPPNRDGLVVGFLNIIEEIGGAISRSKYDSGIFSVLSSTNHCIKWPDYYELEILSGNIVEAIAQRDKDLILSYFSAHAISSSESLDDDFERLFDLLGDRISVETFSPAKEVGQHSGMQICETLLCLKVASTNGNYYIGMKLFTRNDLDPTEVGLRTICVIPEASVTNGRPAWDEDNWVPGIIIK